jgi:hypothetical protein
MMKPKLYVEGNANFIFRRMDIDTTLSSITNVLVADVLPIEERGHKQVRHV